MFPEKNKRGALRPMRSFSGDAQSLELRTKAIGFELFADAEEKTPSIFQAQWWENQLLEWAMKNEAMKTQMLRFVDIFPALRTPRQIAAHLRQYFPRSNRSFPAFLSLGIDAASPTAFSRSLLARETRAMMMRMAHKFIAGADIEDSLDVLRRIRQDGMTYTLDLLGEAVVSEAEADRYMNDYINALDIVSGSAGENPLAPANISLKLSSLYSQFDPVNEAGSKEIVKQRLRRIFRAAKKAGHTGSAFGCAKGGSGSRFGRGRTAALALSLRSPSRRVVVMTRVVRHRGKQFRSAPLAHKAGLDN